MGSITTTGFCTVTGRYAAYGILGSPGTWGSTGACAWCDATTQTVYTNPSNPSGYTFQCDPSGRDNSMACTLISSCSQSGPGYYPALASSIQTVSYVGSGPGCKNDIFQPDYGECSTVKYVTSTILLESGGAAMYTPSVTTQPYEMTTSFPSATTTRAQVIGGPCARPYDRPASCGGVDSTQLQQTTGFSTTLSSTATGAAALVDTTTATITTTKTPSAADKVQPYRRSGGALTSIMYATLGVAVSWYGYM